MSGGQHRVDEVTRTESRGLDRKNNPRIAAHRPPKETAGLRNAGVCAKGTKKSSTLLTWPTSLEMLRNPLITTYLKLGHSGQNQPNRKKKLIVYERFRLVSMTE